MSTDVISREALQKRQGSVWDYVSASRLTLWAKCGLAFKLCYVDGLKRPVSPAMFLGHRVHAGLELAYRHRQLGLAIRTEEVLEKLDASWDQAVLDDGMQFATTAEESELRHKANSLVATYLDQVPADEPRPLAVETTIEVPLIDPETGEDLGIPLVGIVDLVLDRSDGSVIVDFKTAARGGELLPITNEVQLSCYAYGFRQLTNDQEVELQIRRLLKTKVPRVETHAYPARSDQHFRRLFTLIRAYLDDLDAGRFVYRPGFGCSLCDYQDSCQSWLA